MQIISSLNAPWKTCHQSQFYCLSLIVIIGRYFLPSLESIQQLSCFEILNQLWELTFYFGFCNYVTQMNKKELFETFIRWIITKVGTQKEIWYWNKTSSLTQKSPMARGPALSPCLPLAMNWHVAHTDFLLEAVTPPTRNRSKRNILQ